MDGYLSRVGLTCIQPTPNSGLPAPDTAHEKFNSCPVVPTIKTKALRESSLRVESPLVSGAFRQVLGPIYGSNNRSVAAFQQGDVPQPIYWQTLAEFKSRRHFRSERPLPINPASNSSTSESTLAWRTDVRSCGLHLVLIAVGDRLTRRAPLACSLLVEVRIRRSETSRF